MLERRQSFRGRVYYGGRIAFNGRKSTVDCIVRNFSSAGAKVEFENTAILPDHVDLTIDHKGVSFLAHMIWRRNNEAGFLFRTPVPVNSEISNSEMSLDWALRLRAGERANKALRLQVDELRSGH